MTAWPGLEIRREDRADGTVLLVAGEIDIAQAARLEEEIALATRGPREVLVDLSAVTFCDSSGLAALLRARRSHAELRLLAGEAVSHVAKLACVDERLFGAAPAEGADAPAGENAAG